MVWHWSTIAKTQSNFTIHQIKKTKIIINLQLWKKITYITKKTLTIFPPLTLLSEIITPSIMKSFFADKSMPETSSRCSDDHHRRRGGEARCSLESQHEYFSYRFWVSGFGSEEVDYGSDNVEWSPPLNWYRFFYIIIFIC